VARQLRPFLRRPRLDLAIIATASAVAGLLEAAVLILVVNGAVAITDGTSSMPIELPIVGVEASIGQVLWTAAGLTVAVALLNTVVSWLSARVGTEVLETSRHRAIEAFLGSAWTTQSAERQGSIQETATTLAFQSSSLTMTLIARLSAGLVLAALFVAAVLIDPVVTAIMLAFGVVLFAVFRPVSRVTRRHSSRYVEANSAYTEDVARMADMSMELRVFGVESQMLGALDRAAASANDSLRRTRFVARLGTTLYRDVAVLFLVAAVAALDLAGADRVVEVGAVALLIVRSLGYATLVQSAGQQVSELAPNLETLRARLERLEAGREPAGSTAITTFDVIELVDVGYSYDDRVPALRDVDLTIRRGEVLGIVGPSGSGKSTLLQILLRLRRPVEGAVLIDGVDYSTIDPTSWSHLVAVVPQEPQLIEASIADNITFLRPDVTRDDVERAAEAAHVAAEVRELPDGFDTLLGPRGTGLSGGQKQRIAFARALAGTPRLLILDEPTSALDGESERRIRDTISELRGHVTMVIVAHRLSTLDVCDHVITITDGRIEATVPPSA
jgi:ABC-type multidrug transport system fused ATPase/permease subunit